MKIVFFGTPYFAAKTLTFLLSNGVNIVAVVTKPDRPQGRSQRLIPTPVKEVALSHTPPLQVFQPEIVSDMAFAPTLSAIDADLFVVVAYGEIIRQHLLDMPRLGCINVHASLLPKYRGAAPIQQAIIHGEKESGVTIMHMVKRMDAGDIIKMVKVPIEDDMTYGELESKLCDSGCQALLEVLYDYDRGMTPPRYAQDEQFVTFAKKIELKDTQIDWHMPAATIHNLVRGINPEPGAWCFITIKGEKKRLKIKKTRIVKGLNGTPGTLLHYGKEGFIVATGEDAIEILELQLEGKKSVHSAEFIRGLTIETML